MKCKLKTISLALLAVSFLFAYFPAPVPGSILADMILVIKSQKRLLLLKNGEVIKSYEVALGRRRGPKVRRGDNRTPEGTYIIDRRNARSRFYKSLHISYPNRSDLIKTRKRGCSPGASIWIHGLPKAFADLGAFQARYNWTKGCIAVTNAEMDELWALVPNGTPIKIIP